MKFLSTTRIHTIKRLQSADNVPPSFWNFCGVGISIFARQFYTYTIFGLFSVYRCQYCAKTFTRKEHMVNHVRKHTGETPHRCDICKKSFTRKEHFMNHVMWHTGETPHHCQVCGKKYTRKEHLANHMRSHTNDTPFRCEICGEFFFFYSFVA